MDGIGGFAMKNKWGNKRIGDDSYSKKQRDDANKTTR